MAPITTLRREPHLRKFLTAAIAALTAVAIVSVANAQDPQDQPSATMDVTVSPSNAGTRTKPKPEKITLEVENGDSSQTADELKIYVGKRLKFSTTGLRKCDGEELDAQGKDACPSASRVGKGTARAKAGVNTAAPADLTFNVTAFLTGSKEISFYLEQQGGNIRVRAPGKLKRASGDYRTLLDVQIPQLAREFPTGTFNGLVGLETTLYKKVGRRSLITSTGCSNREHPFKLEIGFMPNPNPPKAEKVTALGTANCTK
jgi:hypothetical protein